MFDSFSPWFPVKIFLQTYPLELTWEVLDPRKHRGKDYKRLDGLSTCLEEGCRD